MITKSKFKSKLKNQEPVLGTWITSPSTHILDSICKSAIDFVILDQEHGAIDSSNFLPLINTAVRNDTVPIVRPSHTNLQLCQTALDSGAYGLQFPNISDVEDANQAIKYSKYPPLGLRGFSPFVPASSYINNGTEWNKSENDHNSIILNIEGTDAIENAEKICSIENCDCIFVGLFDLSKALGIPGKVKDTRVRKLLAEVASIAKRNSKSVGTIASSHSDLTEFKEMGLNYFVYLVDTNMIRCAYDEIALKFKKSN